MTALRKWLCAFVLLTALTATAVQAETYHGLHQTYNLAVDSSLVTFMFNTNTPILQQQELFDAYGRITGVVADTNLPVDFLACSLSTGAGYDAFVDSLRNEPVVAYAEPYYRDSAGVPLLVGMEFFVAFNEGVDEDYVDSVCNANDVHVVRQLPLMTNVWVLRNEEGSGHGLVALANSFHDLPTTRYGHPLFEIKPVLCSFVPYSLHDHYADYETQIKRVIGQFNQASVWDFHGVSDTVIVAVIDNGVAPHEDLPVHRLVPGWDWLDNDPDPSPDQSGYHGMACAGLIAASHTKDSVQGLDPNSGVFGIAPAVKIMPVRVCNEDDGSDLEVYNAYLGILWAYSSGADVISCSWTYPSANFAYASLEEAIENAANFGRNGKGCVVVFAAGNHAAWFSGVEFPANVDGVTSVGAINQSDQRYSYSSYGPGLDLVAPSSDVGTSGHMWTIDQMYSYGANDGGPRWDCPPTGNDMDYNCKFGGTSASAPLVAGAAAMVISRNPNLTRFEVERILKHSADTALASGAFPTYPSTQYGYGCVDAFRAILAMDRGDLNNDGDINIIDMTWMIGYMFGTPEPKEPIPSIYVADCSCNGSVDIVDLTWLQSYLFSGGPVPVTPCFRPWKEQLPQ